MPVITEVVNGFNMTFGKKTCFKPTACLSCPLFKKLLISPDYSEYKRVIIIGEGPGKDERQLMKPFTGASGQLLRAVVEATESREFGIGYTNVLLCEDSGALSDEEWQDAIDCCYDRLCLEIDTNKPDLIVVLGNIPKDVIIPDIRKGIGSLTGTVVDVPNANYNVLCSFHPAFILRTFKMYETFWDAINEIRLYFIEKPGPFTSKPGSLKAIKELWKYDLIGIDNETTSFSPFDSGTFEVNQKPYEYGSVLCTAMVGINNNKLSSTVAYVFTPFMLKKYKLELKDLLEAKGVVCHNGQFDVPFLNMLGFYPELKDDPMLMDYSTDESPSHPLKRLSRKYLGIQDWSTVLDPYLNGRKTSYAAIPKKILYHYCGLDTAIMSPLKNYISDKMEEGDNKIYRTLLMPAANMFIDIYNRGIRVDVLKLLTLKDKWQKELWEYMKELRWEFGIRNPNSPFQVSKALIRFKVVAYDVETRKTEITRLGELAAKQGNKKGARLVELINLYRETEKALNTFLRQVAIFTRYDGRVHPDFKLFGTVTGRLTGSSPNFLNYPKATRFSKELRELFIPDPGYIWGHWDQKQFELRVYGVISDDRDMKSIILAGRDPHAETGHRVYGVEGYNRRYKETRGLIRTIIKTVVFGRLYLRGVESVAYGLGISIAESEELCEAVDGMWGGIVDYRNGVEYQLQTDQVIRNPLGRARRFPVLTDDNYQECLKQACNFPIQSTASDLNLLGMIQLHNGDPRVIPLFPIHDAVEALVLEKDADEVIEYTKEVLSDVPYSILNVEDMKFETDSGIGSSWSEASLDWD